MKTTRLILASIESDIDALSLTKIQKKRAKLLCSGILENIIKFKHSLLSYIEIPQGNMISFTEQQDKKMYLKIKKALISANILLTDGRYINNLEFQEQECLGYKFNSKYFNESLFTFNNVTTGFNGKPIDMFKVKEILNQIEIVDKDKMMSELLQEAQNPTYSIIKLKIDGNYYIVSENKSELLESNYLKVKNIKGKEYAHITWLHKKAINEDKKVIYCKGKVYIDTEADFKYRKQVDIMCSTAYALSAIENKNFNVSRNKTNNRLDTSITNLKSLVIDYMRLDGEKLKELDVTNSQFANAVYANSDLDVNFKEIVKTGKLYDFVAEHYGISRKEAKSLMFRISFDKSRKKYDSMRELFPKFMKWNDTFKDENGYEEFSNMLARTEAMIMIDGALSLVLESGYKALSVHDSLRVKESEYEVIKTLVQNYFDSIGFECTIKQK